MSMQENIARAMASRAAYVWDQMNDGERLRWFAYADAVLDALMEPTELMIYEGEGYCDFVLPAGFDNSGEGRRREFRMGFCSAIRAAKEGK